MPAALLDSLDNIAYIIRYLGNKYYIRSAADPGVEGEPTRVTAHEFNNEHAAMRGCRRMDIINNICRNVNGALEPEGGIGSPNVVVNGLWQGHNVHARVHEQLCTLLSAVAAHYDKAVEIEAVVGILHGGDKAVALIVHDVLSRDILLTRGAEYSAALGEYAGKILRLHEFVVAVD